MKPLTHLRNPQMRVLFILLVLSSCVQIRFENAQPLGFETYTTIPEELRGTYVSNRESKAIPWWLSDIPSKSASSKNVNDSLLISETEVNLMFYGIRMNPTLSDSLILKKLNDTCYVFSSAQRDTFGDGIIAILSFKG